MRPHNEQAIKIGFGIGGDGGIGVGHCTEVSRVIEVDFRTVAADLRGAAEASAVDT